MTPQVQRILMTIVGAGLVVAAFLLPQTQTYLLPAGIGFLGWAAPAPGHAGDKVEP